MNAKFDAAVAALLLVQAARHYPTGFSHSSSGGMARTVDVEGLNRRMTEQSIDFYIQSTAAAKTALVAIEQYVPEVRNQLTASWELAEADEPALRQAIEGRRAMAAKTERLLRQRKAAGS